MNNRHYYGITYPKFLDNRFAQWLWFKFMCPEDKHLFDEMLTADEHYLYCDACGLEVHIDHISMPGEFA